MQRRKQIRPRKTRRMKIGKQKGSNDVERIKEGARRERIH